MIGWILEGVKRFFWWVIDLIVGLALLIVEPLLSALPPEFKAKVAANLAQLQGVLSFADHWFPFVEVAGMVVLYWAFCVAWSVVKLLVKMIPGVG